MPYETGFKWTRPTFLLKRLFWSIWNQFQMEYGIFIQSEWNWFQIDQMNIFVKKIILVYLKPVSNVIWHFYWSCPFETGFIWPMAFLFSLNENWFQIDQNNFLTKLLVWSIWNQFHSDWICFCTEAMLPMLNTQCYQHLWVNLYATSANHSQCIAQPQFYRTITCLH